MSSNEYNRIMGFSAGFRFGYAIGNNNIPYDFKQMDDYIKTHHRFETGEFKWHCKSGIRAGCTQGSYDKLVTLPGVTELKCNPFKRHYINDTETLPDYDVTAIELDYYDGPLMMFLNKGEDQQYIIIMLERARDFDFWLYIPVTTEVLSKLKAGEFTLTDAKLATQDRLYIVRENYYAARTTLDLLPDHLDIDGDDWYLNDKIWDYSGNISHRKSESEILIDKLNKFIADGSIKPKMEGMAVGYEWSHYPTLIYKASDGLDHAVTIGRASDWL